MLGRRSTSSAGRNDHDRRCISSLLAAATGSCADWVQLGYRTQISEARSVTDMPFMSIDDPEFWKNCPQGLELISKSMEGTGGGVAYFVMGEPKDNAPTVVALRMAPNWVLPRHAHDCYRFEVVV
jgi:hypothetical protein